MMRKNILGLSFLFLSSLLLAACGSKTPASSAPVSSPDVSTLLKAKAVEVYRDKTTHQSISLYFEDAMPEIPFISLEFAQQFLVSGAQENGAATFDITSSKQDSVVTWTREKDNGSTVVFDFTGKTVTFSAFEAFSEMPFAVSPLDPVSLDQKDASGNPLYIIHDQSKSAINNAGQALSLNLAHYAIPMVYQDGTGYLPLQFFSDFFSSQTVGLLTYNGSSVFLSGSDLGEMSDLFYSVEAKSRSASLIDYNYHELCLALDVYYGLKSQHGITDFDSYLTACGLKADLLSTDSAKASAAIMKLTNWHLEDLHSGFSSPSAYAGANSVTWTYSPDMKAQEKAFSLYSTAREAVLKTKTPSSYYEDGDTAFVTFDHFTSLAADYYTNPVTEAPLLVADPRVMAPDTFAVVTYAHSQITRANTPIKNVVIDLSCNGGGALDALAYVAGWLVDDDILDVESTASGIRAENYYRVDTNLDKTFDAKDKISDKKLYCLVSPSSFSCGNYLPSMLKIRQKATLIGQTSGGGGCMVKPLGTADGTLFQISGNMSMRVAHNGSFNDIDQGMEPDYRLGDPYAFYDRATMAKDIDDGVYGKINS